MIEKKSGECDICGADLRNLAIDNGNCPYCCSPVDDPPTAEQLAWAGELFGEKP